LFHAHSSPRKTLTGRSWIPCYFPSSSDDFPPFLVSIRRAVRHGFMSNNGLFMLVHTGALSCSFIAA
ncbi:hypothetical protein, partial [Enterococcus faecium]|uniref:hypothetical protein n=1 Tax=Enterococcus faecium TaxID=1352 RepID=UPI003F9EF65F